MESKVIIPARLHSTRLPKKLLLSLGDEPIIVKVYKRALNIPNINTVYVATDSQEIFDVCNQYNCKVIMTDANHTSGTDRIFEAATKLNSDENDIIINIQGDEPFFPIEAINNCIKILQNNNIEVATLATKITLKEEIENPNNVKVVINNFNEAIYFSRSVIPYNRDNTSGVDYYKHIGIYLYKYSALKKFVQLKGKSKLELIEKLEQLRLIENKIPIYVYIGNFNNIGIDTEEDYKLALKLINKNEAKNG